MSVNIDLVIFDCDGVLIDSEVISARVLVEELARLANVQTSIDYIYQNFLGKKFQSVIDNIYQTFNVGLPANFEVEYRNTLLARFDQELTTTRGLTDMLQDLAVPACIATSSSPERTKRALQKTGLDRYFGDHVFTASEVKNGKPAPDLFLHAAKRMGVKAQNCLVIEDSPAGMQAAISASMQLVHYTGGLHLEGKPVSNACPTDATVLTHWQAFFEAYPKLRMKLKPIS